MIVIRWGTYTPPAIVQWANLDQTVPVQSPTSTPSPIAVLIATGGSGTTTFVWSPPQAQTTWVIPHNLNRYPSVTVTDSNNEILIPDIKYLDANLIEVKFAYPTSGYAYIV